MPGSGRSGAHTEHEPRRGGGDGECGVEKPKAARISKRRGDELCQPRRPVK